MAPKLTTIDASEPLDKILAIIARDGGVVVSNFLAPELLNELMRAGEYGARYSSPKYNLSSRVQ